LPIAKRQLLIEDSEGVSLNPNRQSAIGNRQSAISDQQSALGNAVAS
jgi:hypothetical protein